MSSIFLSLLIHGFFHVFRVCLIFRLSMCEFSVSCLGFDIWLVVVDSMRFRLDLVLRAMFLLITCFSSIFIAEFEVDMVGFRIFFLILFDVVRVIGFWILR